MYNNMIEQHCQYFMINCHEMFLHWLQIEGKKLLVGVANFRHYINWSPNNDHVTQYEQGLLIEMYEPVTEQK